MGDACGVRVGWLGTHGVFSVMDAPQLCQVQSSEGATLDFRTVFDTQFEYVWHTLRRLGVRDADLKDQTQEVFLVVHQLFDDYDRARPIRPWLVGGQVAPSRMMRRATARGRPQRSGAVIPHRLTASTVRTSTRSSRPRRVKRALTIGRFGGGAELCARLTPRRRPPITSRNGFQWYWGPFLGVASVRELNVRACRGR